MGGAPCHRVMLSHCSINAEEKPGHWSHGSVLWRQLFPLLQGIVGDLIISPNLCECSRVSVINGLLLPVWHCSIGMYNGSYMSQLDVWIGKLPPWTEEWLEAVKWDWQVWEPRQAHRWLLLRFVTVSLVSPGWPWTVKPPALASQVLILPVQDHASLLINILKGCNELMLLSKCNCAYSHWDLVSQFCQSGATS